MPPLRLLVIRGDLSGVIVSGSPRADIEEAVRLRELNCMWVCAPRRLRSGKPSPGFLEGARRLGVPPQESYSKTLKQASLPPVPLACAA